jgi:hypothetical protein
MIITKGEPWLMWPDKVSFGINKGNIGDILEGKTDFTLSIELNIMTYTNNKRTIFAKLPNYCGIDLDVDDRLLLILKLVKNNEEYHKYIMSDESLPSGFNLLTYQYSKKNRTITILINSLCVISYIMDIDEELTQGIEPHIIFGAGNFPHNDFNLNYCSFDLNFLMLSKSYKTYEEILNIKNNNTKDDTIIALFDFKNYTNYKVYDNTGNCNFLHKIMG